MALLHVFFRSQTLELQMAMDVLLPDAPSQRPDGKWPTLYLLHGLSDNHTIWQRRTSIERYVDGMPLAVIMPSVHRSFYTDMKHGGNYWQFISQELPARCEMMFPLSTARKDRFAAGLSMGGYGAFKLGLNCPDRYAAAASLSGAVDMLGLSEENNDRHDDQFYTDIFGSREEMEGSENDLVAAANRLIQSGKEMPKFYMCCGTEDFLYENNQGFLKAFRKPLNITYEEGPGEHTWDFWDAYIQHVLKWLPLD